MSDTYGDILTKLTDELLKEHRKLCAFSKHLIPALRDHNLNNLALELEAILFSIDKILEEGDKIANMKTYEDKKVLLELLMKASELTEEQKTHMLIQFEKDFFKDK